MADEADTEANDGGGAKDDDEPVDRDDMCANLGLGIVTCFKSTY